MGFLKLYRPLLFYLCALVCRKCCREFNGQLYGEPVRLEWNKPRLRKENLLHLYFLDCFWVRRYTGSTAAELVTALWTEGREVSRGISKKHGRGDMCRSNRQSGVEICSCRTWTGHERKPGVSSPATSLLTPTIPANEVRNPIPICDPSCWDDHWSIP